MPVSEPQHYLVHNCLLANALAACDLLDLRVDFRGVVQERSGDVIRVHLALTWLGETAPDEAARALLELYGQLRRPIRPTEEEG